MGIRATLRLGSLALLASISLLAVTSATSAQSISMVTSDWTVDRAGGTVFEQTDWQGRSSVLRLGIRPPASQSSFYNWQGYSQRVDVPAGNSYLRGDLWIPQAWGTGTTTDYVRTGLWGSAMPEATVDGGHYVNDDAAFPIISFTNVNGVGRLEVWKTTVTGGVSSGAWEEIAGTADSLSYDGWNTLDMHLLPGGDKVEYLLNGEVFYTWEMPRSEGNDPVAPEQLWAVYLKARNNGVTEFDTYWSRLMAGVIVDETAPIVDVEGDLVLDGTAPEVTIGVDLPGSLNVSGGDTGKTVVFSAPVNIGDSVYSTGSNLVFSKDPDTPTIIVGNLELGENSSTSGGTTRTPVQVQGDVQVSEDSVFGGNFYVDGTVHNAGTTSPGNSIGLQISTGVAWSSTSTYAVEVDGAGHADLVVVTSTTPLDLGTMGSVTVSSLTPGSVLIDHDYVIFATAADFTDVSGMFDPATALGDLAYLTPHLRLAEDFDLNTLDIEWPSSFTPGQMTAVVLKLTADGAALKSAAATPNQSAVADAIEGISGSNAAAAAAFGQPGAAAAQQALAQLSGSSQASVTTVVLEGGNLLDDLVTRRLRQGDSGVLQGSPLMGYAPFEAPTLSPGSPVMWGEMIGAWGAADDPVNGGRLERRTGGLMVGLESDFGDGARLGVVGSYSATSFSLAPEGASGNVDAFRVELYGTANTAGVVLRGGAAYAHNGVSLQRNVTMVGFTDTLTSSYNVGVASGFVEAALPMALGDLWFEPFVGLSGSRTSGYDYAEAGGAAALSGSVAGQLIGWTTLGARLSQDVLVFDSTLLQLSASLSWRHAFGDRQPTAVHALAGGAGFTAAGVVQAEDVFAAELASSYWLTSDSALSLSYQGTLAANQQGHAVQAGLSVNF